MCKIRSSPFSLQVPFLKLSCSEASVLPQGKAALGDICQHFFGHNCMQVQGKTISALEEEPVWAKGKSSQSNMKGINSSWDHEKVLEKAFRKEGWDTGSYPGIEWHGKFPESLTTAERGRKEVGGKTEALPDVGSVSSYMGSVVMLKTQHKTHAAWYKLSQFRP